MKTKLLICASLAILSFSATDQKNNIGKAEWLIGTWKNTTTKGNIYEIWKKVSPNELFGKSYSLKNNDTLIFETMRLISKENKLFYIPTVRNQNKSLPVRFIASKISGKELIFENRHHDFPQIISYKKISKDSLVAEISGQYKGKVRKEAFPMRRN